MMKSTERTSFQFHGVSTLSRRPQALSAEYCSLDERSLSELLHLIHRFSKSVSYTNTKNELDGDWSEFFKNNLAFLLSDIACFDEIEAANRIGIITSKLKSTDDNVELNELYFNLVLQTYRLFRQFDEWYKRSKRNIEHISDNVLDPHLHNAIQTRLSPLLHDLRPEIEKLINTFPEGQEFHEFQFNQFEPVWSISNGSPKNEVEKADLYTSSTIVTRIHKNILATITHLKHIAPNLLNRVITDYPYHEPHVSLIISFLQAYKHVQADLNEITRRHLDYYFRNVLKQSPRYSFPDRVHVCFELAQHINQTTISAGTLLSAGVDEEGRTKNYLVSSDIQVHHSRIEDLLVVHVANNPSIGIGTSFKDVSNIYSSKILFNRQGFVINESGKKSSAFLFGRDQADISLAHRDMRQATVGFAISSSVLILNEGNRTVSLTLKFHLKSMTSLVSFVEEIAINEGLSADNAFYKILNNIFRLRITTPEGWFETYRYDIVRPKAWTDGEIQINVSLDVSEPAVSCYSSALHGFGYETKWPIFEFHISSKYAMYAYSYLKDLAIEECRIAAEVHGIKDLSVFNDQGQLDIQMPFYPFGSNPDMGSYILLGHSELFTKQIDDISFDIQWHNLPRIAGGFESYYREYGQEIKNDSFKVGVSGLSEFHFHPKEESNIQKFNLFELSEEGQTLRQKRALRNIDITKLKIKPSYAPVDVSNYTAKTRTGFIKLELMEPEMGFGFDLFPRLFSDAVIKNAQSNSGILGTKEGPKVDLPKNAFAPQMRSIALNYKASTVLTFLPDRASDNDERIDDRIFHIHPFGNTAIFKNGLPETNVLLGQYDDEGYLYIGLSELNPPLNLTLYFQLEYNALNVINFSDIPKVKWSYLVGNQWVEFDRSGVISDGTNNFTTSGIVELKLPSGMDISHDILPDGKFWISASIARNTQILSRMVFVSCNAAVATWQPHKAGVNWENNISSETITGFIKSRSDIVKLSQPFPSFGGNAGETDDQFHIRVSERLKHKNRVVNPEDYERIILEKFPNIFQALCLTSTEHPSFVSPGELRVIVVPKFNPEGPFLFPRVDYNGMKVIEDTLIELASPFVKLKVINPIYEKVRISCSVQFTGGSSAGEYVSKLEDDIRSFLCPWFGEQQGEMLFDQGIEQSQVYSFIESLDYVNFVTRLSIVVLHYKNGKYSISDSAAEEGKLNRIRTSSPWSVLVPDENQDIAIINRTIHGRASETKIDTMKVGSDFVISEEEEEEIVYPYFDHERDVFYAIKIDL